MHNQATPRRRRQRLTGVFETVWLFRVNTLFWDHDDENLLHDAAKV